MEFRAQVESMAHTVASLVDSSFHDEGIFTRREVEGMPCPVK